MNKKAYTRLILLILILCLCVPLAGCGKASDDPKRVEQIIEEIAVDYGTYGAEAEDRITTLLKELSSADAVTGKRWDVSAARTATSL